MRGKWAIVGVCGVVAAAGAAYQWHRMKPPSAEEQWALLGGYCTDCHNSADFAGGVAFDRLDPERIHADAETWEAAVRKLRGGLMPPPGAPRPETERLDSFVAWLETRLDSAAEVEAEPHVGTMALRRMNREEYANAVRDLLGVDVDASALLPQDPEVAGFDNIGSALQVSPSFIEQYVTAARSVAAMALGDDDARPSSRSYQAEHPGTGFGATTPPGGRPYHVEGLPPGTRGGLVVDHVFPADGEYAINIAGMASALWTYAMEFENKVVVTVDGKKVYETVIGGEADMKAIDQEQDAAVDAINARLKNIRFDAEAGQRKVAVTFVRRSYAESDDPLHQLRQGVVRGIGQDRVLRVDSFEISGPFGPLALGSTPSRDRIFSCYPRTPAEESLCAEEIVSTLAERAFRRPIGERELQQRLEYYEAGRQSGDFEEGIRMAVTGILASPQFLYRAERVPEGVEPGSSYPISDLELATRLAFFLWNSIPDDELRGIAARGQLRQGSTLAEQVRRMLADPRAETLASHFAFQWLELKKMDVIEPDRASFPGSSGANDLRDAFRREITLFVDSIFREDRSVVDLLTADHTFVNERLAWHYGINDVRGDQFRRVELDEPARFGLLGKGAVLLASSYPNRTSPVLRGQYVMANLIGAPPAAPPPDVEDNLDAADRGFESLTVREKLTRHRASPNCSGCHNVIDPLGFALENFDVDGAWRDIDRASGKPIDPVGELPDGNVLEGPADLRQALLARPEQFVQTFTERLMTYALGRTLDYHDMPTVRRVVRESGEEEYRFSAVVMAIVESDLFQKRSVPNGGDDVPAMQAAAGR